MASFDRKVKRAQKKSESKKDKWQDLVSLRNECLTIWMDFYSKLVEVEKTFAKTIEENPSLKQVIAGVSKTYDDIADKIVHATKQHTIPTEKLDANGKPILEFKTGVVKPNSDEEMTYINVKGQYETIMIHLADIMPEGLTVVLTELRVFNNVIKQEDLNMINNAVSQGQDKILKTLQEGASNVGNTTTTK